MLNRQENSMQFCSMNTESDHKLAQELREKGYKVEMIFSGSSTPSIYYGLTVLRGYAEIQRYLSTSSIR